MTRPDWCPQRVWDAALEVAVGQEWAHPLVVHAIARAILSAEQREREACVAFLKDKAASTPLGHESRERGASTYNWLTHCASLIRNRGTDND